MSTGSEVHPWLAFPNLLTLLSGLRAQLVASKATVSNVTVSLWIPSSPLTGMLSSPNQSPTCLSRHNLNASFPCWPWPMSCHFSLESTYQMYFYESHKVHVEQGLHLSWEGTVDNSRPILPLNLGLFPRCTAVTSQRTHFFFCNLKVKIIQGRFRKNICDCQINQVSIKSMENISVRNQREARQMITVRVTERPLQRYCSGLVPLCALSSLRLRGEPVFRSTTVQDTPNEQF